MKTIWSPGSYSGSQVLIDGVPPNGDQLFPAQLNELRQAVNNLEDFSNLTTDFGRQMLINGNFDIWQNNVSFVNLTTGSYWADKHKLAFDIGVGTLPSTITITKGTLVPDELWGSNFYANFNFSDAGVIAAASYYTFYNTVILIPKYFHAGSNRYLTYSFMAKSDIPGKRVGTSLGMYYGWGGGSASVIGSTFTLTSTWTKYTTIFELPSLAGETWFDDVHLLVIPKVYLAWGSSVSSQCGAITEEDFGGSGNLQITQQDLSFTNGAIQFYPKSWQQEYQDCLYFLKKSYPYGIYAGAANEEGSIENTGAGGNCTIGDILSSKISHEMSMRVAAGSLPLVYDMAGAVGKVSARNADGSLTNGITGTVDLAGPKGFRVYAVTTAVTQRGIVFHYVQNVDV